MASPVSNHQSVLAGKSNPSSPSSPNQVLQQSTSINEIGLNKATVDHSLAPKAELDSDGSSSSISAPPTTGMQSSSNKMEEMVNGRSSLSSSSEANHENNGNVKQEESFDQNKEKSEDSPAAGYDFDADPALWGLRRSGRAPKKSYADSSAGEGSDDEITITGGKTRTKNGRARGKHTLKEQEKPQLHLFLFSF